jgi:hypothetical protein
MSMAIALTRSESVPVGGALPAGVASNAYSPLRKPRTRRAAFSPTSIPTLASTISPSLKRSRPTSPPVSTLS